MAAILLAILIIACRTKCVFELEGEIDGRHPYMKFLRIQLKMTIKSRLTTTADTNKRRPFCLPSWLSFVEQNPYSNLKENLMDAIHIYEIWKKSDKKWLSKSDHDRILIGDGHFVCHLSYPSLEKTRIRTWKRVWWKPSIYEVWRKSD